MQFEDAHYRHSVHTIGKKMSEQRLGIYACLCAFSCRHPARNAVRPTNMGPGFAEERQLRTLRSMIVWFTNPPGATSSWHYPSRVRFFLRSAIRRIGIIRNPSSTLVACRKATITMVCVCCCGHRSQPLLAQQQYSASTASPCCIRSNKLTATATSRHAARVTGTP
jgi:hypothetical protein